MDIERHYWNTREAAAYIGVHPDTLRAYCKGKSALGKAGKRVIIQTRVPPHTIFGLRTLRFPIDAFKKWANLEGRDENAARKRARKIEREQRILSRGTI